MKLITRRRVKISPFGSQELAIKELDGVDPSKIVVRTSDGKTHSIRNANRPGRFIVRFIGQTPRSFADVDFLLNDDSQTDKKPEEIKDIVAADAPKPPESKNRLFGRVPFFKKLQDRQIERKELNLKEIEGIRKKDLSHKNLAGKKILTFDYSGCWARGLGMIQKAHQLQYELKRPLHDYYDRICGQGDGAIIAAAMAAGIGFDALASWWTSDWRKVHSPGFPQKAKRWAVSKFKPNASGYDAKKARAALKKLFLIPPAADRRMRDALTELQITVMQADMNISTHLSSVNPELELYIAVEDSAVTKISYNQGETIKGEAVFLGAIEKNDDIGLMLSKNNKKLAVTSIGAPVRINPPAAVNLKKLGHAADKAALQSAGHFVYQRRVGQLIEKLREAGYDINYIRLECLPMDSVVRNNAGDEAMRAGIESGSGKLRTLFRETRHENVSQ
jgi:hypothetical protein